MPSPGVTQDMAQTIVNKAMIENIIDPVASDTAGLVVTRSTDLVLHTPDIGVVHTSITLQTNLQLVASIDSFPRAGGAQIMTFPTGYIQIHRTRITGRLTTNVADLTSTAGEIGMGIIVASGTTQQLGGNASFENIMEGGIPALGNFVANTNLVIAAAGGARTGLLGGFSTAVPVFLNMASNWADIAAQATVSAMPGTVIEIWWSRVGN